MIEVIGEESIVRFGGVDTFAVQRTQQPMIAEQHGQSCSTMCVEPTVALEPQVVGGVATPNQKTKMYVQCVITNSFYFIYLLTTVCIQQSI
ncbi:hypothetical protein DPMN_108736 [Dreissena polymorpha]|uniref:Uncharacterized protein n=1 Tax=Dreissena polymorpha TaxID=45954 RepID=A0A9D4K9E1_DREPO|nr:hypothetical protein DPMN_108736 [Dreissena polymorpha]